MTAAAAQERAGLARPLAALLTAVAMTAALLGVPGPADAAATPELTEVSGRLDDGTPYLLRVPDGWNGTVLVDYDYASFGHRRPVWDWLHANGYAGAGTTRTVVGFDLRRGVANQLAVMDLFEAEFGTPERVIAAGASGGGQVAALVAQHHPDRIDGAIAMCGSLAGFVALLNVNQLDTTFALKALIAPDSDLPVDDLPRDSAASVASWHSALADAQGTAAGRARIALAGVIGQLPAWSVADMPQPDGNDAHALQEGLYRAITTGGVINRAMGRHAVEAAAGGNPTWNVGVDYQRIFQMGDPELRRAVRTLYRDAGLDLRADLARINATDRIEADPAAVEFFHDGHSFDGSLQVPVLTMSLIGDPSTTITMQQAYEQKVRTEGNASLLRTTYVRGAGHCTFTAAEMAAAVETMTARLDTGRWADSAQPRAMNELATSLGIGESRFISYQPRRFSRPFYLDDHDDS